MLSGEQENAMGRSFIIKDPVNIRENWTYSHSLLRLFHITLLFQNNSAESTNLEIKQLLLLLIL